MEKQSSAWRIVPKPEIHCVDQQGGRSGKTTILYDSTKTFGKNEEINAIAKRAKQR